ncbi:hypothetical protein [Baaleninema simplex]|uniref:hypothetical protein n=1 Tax=Baaleninema simplex TaxID=2862350 RepID=UPI000349F493|nr:hypothetical protein [Baaleninema simplex]
MLKAAISHASPRTVRWQDLDPICLDRWFPRDYQRHYMSQLVGKGGLTRRRAEYFVRLWAYLWLKYQLMLDRGISSPLTELNIPEEFVSCTHREAAALFYADRDRGSHRAAGMMLDKLAHLGLICKQFDGNTVCIKIEPIPSVRALSHPSQRQSHRIEALESRSDDLSLVRG